MIRERILAALLFVVGPATAVAHAGPQSHVRPADSCFDLTQMQGDVPIDDHTVLFRVGVNDVYALDFADKCPELTWPDPQLIIVPAGGITYICHPLDLSIKVTQAGPGGIAIPCIPTGLRKLTPAEVAALPKKDVP